MENKHIFELAGLGVAPFKFSYASWGGWSNCQYCGTAIKEKCFINDVNGNTFFVGNECVNKTGDAGLINEARIQVNELRKKMRHEKEAKQIETGVLLMFAFPELQKLQKGHINLQQWFENCFKWGGNKSKITAVKEVFAVAEGYLSEGKLEDFWAKIDSIKDDYDAVQEKKRLEAEAERNRLHKQAEALRLKIASDNAEIIGILKSKPFSPFISSMLSHLSWRPIYELSARQKEVLGDIYGKNFGQRCTKPYNEALERFEPLCVNPYDTKK